MASIVACRMFKRSISSTSARAMQKLRAFSQISSNNALALGFGEFLRVVQAEDRRAGIRLPPPLPPHRTAGRSVDFVDAGDQVLDQVEVQSNCTSAVLEQYKMPVAWLEASRRRVVNSRRNVRSAGRHCAPAARGCWPGHRWWRMSLYQFRHQFALGEQVRQ